MNLDNRYPTNNYPPSTTNQQGRNMYYSNSSEQAVPYQQPNSGNYNGSDSRNVNHQGGSGDAPYSDYAYPNGPVAGNTMQQSAPNFRDAPCDPRFYGDYNESQLDVPDLVPPLQKIDLNSVPPDVLSYMLKNKRMDHVVAACNNMGSGSYQSAQASSASQPQRQETPYDGSYGQQQRYGGSENYSREANYGEQRSGISNTRGGPQQGNQRLQTLGTESSRDYSAPSNNWNGQPSNVRSPQGQASQNRGSWGDQQKTGNFGGNWGDQKNTGHLGGNWEDHQSTGNQRGNREDHQSTGNQRGNREDHQSTGNQRGNRGYQQNTGSQERNDMNQSLQNRRGNSQAATETNRKPVFSINAKEFKPGRTVYYQQNTTVSQPSPRMAPATATNWSHEMDPIGGPMLEQLMSGQVDETESLPYDPESHYVLDIVTNTLNQLAANPGDFDRAAKATVECFKKYLHDPDTLGVVLLLVVEQSVCGTNFCYTGARLCEVFIKSNVMVPGPPDVTFKNLLLEKCQEEFMTCLEQLNLMEQMPERARGLVMFFAELYLNCPIVKDGETLKNQIYGLASTELMLKLASLKPTTYDNIKSIFQTLKLIGWEIEHETREKFKPLVPPLFEQLDTVRNSADVDDRTTHLLNTLFAIRGRNWDKEPAAVEAVATVATQPANPYGGMNSYVPQYYELPENVEDEDYSVTLDDEPEDVQRAYEEFLRSTGK